MKNILGWIKSNVLVVVFCAIVLLSLPTAFAFSSAWRERIRAERETAAANEMKKVESAAVTYTIPSHGPTQSAIELKAAPNAELTKWFKDQRDKLGQAAGTIVKRAEDFNRGIGPDASAVGRTEHKLFVEGLFPDTKAQATEALQKELGKEAWDAKPEDERKKLVQERAAETLIPKLNEMEEVLLGKRGKPYPYDSLLKSVNAGPPADVIRVSESVKDMNARESEKITAGKRQLTEQESAELEKRLSERRLAEYQESSRNISLYATLDIWPKVITPGFASIPFGKIASENIALEPFFVTQWDYWVFSDIFAAVRLANSASDQSAGVAGSVVKRIESIKLADPQGLFENKDAFGANLDAPTHTPPASTIPGLVPTDPVLSLTGRGMGTWNTVYDLRMATVTAVVSSTRLNEFLDAITRTNFMTVVDLDLAPVDVWADLRDGYYYGDEHVVRATIKIETVWLRSWLGKLMPEAVAGVLGAGPGSAAGGVPAPASGSAAPAPASPRGGAPTPTAGGRGRKGGG